MPLVNTPTNPVAAARVRANLTQVELALRSHKSLSTVRLAEAGIATRSTLTRLAAALNCSIDELTGRKPASSRPLL